MTRQTFKSAATEIFKNIDSKSMFIVLHEYENNYKEVATYSLLWHIDYSRAVQKSYDIITQFKPTIDFCIGKPYSLQDLRTAHMELVESFADTLVLGPGNNPRATSAHAYDQVVDSKGFIVPGVKLHRDQDILHLTDVYRMNKIVHKEGVYPKVNSARKTMAKNDLRKLLPLKRFGQFVLYPGRFKSLSVQKISVTEENVIRSENIQINNKKLL